MKKDAPIVIPIPRHLYETVKAERDAALKDAERYRWLRARAYGTDLSVCLDIAMTGNIADVDAAIDTALASQKAHPNGEISDNDTGDQAK
jgi:hypothetical protein